MDSIRDYGDNPTFVFKATPAFADLIKSTWEKQSRFNINILVIPSSDGTFRAGCAISAYFGKPDILNVNPDPRITDASLIVYQNKVELRFYFQDKQVTFDIERTLSDLHL